MYPSGCKGKNSFFIADDLKRHYQVAHGGIDGSGETVSLTSVQPVVPDNIIDGLLPAIRTSHQAARLETTSSQVIDPQLDIDSILDSASAPANPSVATASAIISPTPNQITRHQLELTSSFQSADSHQTSIGSLRNEASHQSTLQMIEMETVDSRSKRSMSANAQDPAYIAWSHDIIESTIKNLGITRDSAEAYVRTFGGMILDRDKIAFDVPAKDPQSISGEQAGNLVEYSHTSMMTPRGVSCARPQYNQSLSYSTGSSISRVRPRQFAQPPATSTAKHQGSGKDRSKTQTENSARTNEYFLPGDGIDREIITAKICRYLGNEATIRPGSFEDPQTRQIHKGYFITAYGKLTTAMIADLKADSERWMLEKEAIDLNGQPSSGSSGLPVSGQNDELSPGGVTSEVAEASSYMFLSGADMMVDSRYAAQARQYYYAPAPAGVINEFLPGANMLPPVVPRPSSVACPNDTTPISLSAHLWWHAGYRVQQINRELSHTLLWKWRYLGGPFPPNDESICQAIANSQADKLLGVLVLSDELPSKNLTSQRDPTTKTLKAIMTISSVVKVIKSTLNFKVGAFVWTMFCEALEAVGQSLCVITTG
jgi:hypothetical protein